MNKPEWMFSRWRKYLGMPGLAGLVLVMFSAAIFIGLVLPSEARLEHVTSEVAEMQNRLKMALNNPEARAQPVESDLTSFYKLLPPEQGAAKVLDKIYKSANDESLRLTQGEYKFTREKGGRLGSYQIILPVKGNYIQIRKFIAKVLNGVPTAAMNGVSFRREAIGSSSLEAKIQFTIFLGTV